MVEERDPQEWRKKQIENARRENQIRQECFQRMSPRDYALIQLAMPFEASFEIERVLRELPELLGRDVQRKELSVLNGQRHTLLKELLERYSR